MSTLARISLLCVIACFCSVACHLPNHHRHRAPAPLSPTQRVTDAWDAVNHDEDVDVDSSCCSRQQRIVQIGYGVLGYGVEMDVGRCEKSCQLIEGSSEEMDSNSSEQECPRNFACVPASSTLERVFTRSGREEVSVVDSCRCEQIPATCTRTSHVVLMYPGSPYETRLDVGTCSGHCHKGGCRPVRNKTVSLPGPDGSSCHSVIEECSCASSCYRVSYEETVYDYTNVGNNTEDAEPQVKVIDVGACVGSCSARHAGSQICLVRDRNNPSRCLSQLYNKHATCSADVFRVHSYMTRQRRSKQIAAIISCKCG